MAIPDPYRTMLREYFRDRDMPIVGVPTADLRSTNGSTSLILLDTREPPVTADGQAFTVELRFWGARFSHFVPDCAAVQLEHRVDLLAKLTLLGLQQGSLPEVNLPFTIYVENNYRPWRDAARKFRDTYATAARR